MKLTAAGQARHHFWGEYSQTVALFFADESSAELAHRLVLQPSGLPWVCKGKACAAFVTGDEVPKLEDYLVTLGADRSKIGSMKYSVDRGEIFSVTLSAEDPNQLQLFAA